MQLSKRAQSIPESVTLLLNSKAVKLAESGKKIYNLTAGQLPFPPMQSFVDQIVKNCDDLKSFQYCPVLGFEQLRKKCIASIEATRKISFTDAGFSPECIISNGAKHSLTNIMSGIIDPGDDVVVLAPYWISYAEIIKLWGGTCTVVTSTLHNNFEPAMSDVEKAFNKNTKAIIVNSPNNPSGTHYSSEWMKDFAKLMKRYPNISIISDEIYYELNYSGEVPTYYYQFEPTLLKQTIIIDGISKTLASTGLRIGYAVGPKHVIDAIGKIQGQTTSGANSLIQKAMMGFELSKTAEFLAPIKTHLQKNANILKEKFEKAGLKQSFYMPKSAFYFMVDFKHTKIAADYRAKHGDIDLAPKICEDLLDKVGIAMVPGADFGLPNSARLSLVLPPEQFGTAIDLLIDFIN